MSTDTITVVTSRPKPTSKTETDQRRQPPYHVVLLNDDDHTYEYVIEMLQKLFGHPPPKGFELAKEVDTSGRVIVTPKENLLLGTQKLTDGTTVNMVQNVWTIDAGISGLLGFQVRDYSAMVINDQA